MLLSNVTNELSSMKSIRAVIVTLAAFATLLIGSYHLSKLLSRDVQAQDPCCTPPILPAAARFPQGAYVNVYIDANTGFTPTEIQSITDGLQSWNGQPNNSNVTYHVTVTSNLPPPGTNNTIIVSYVNEYSSSTGGSQINMYSVGATTYGEMKFFENIRVGNPSFLPTYVRTVARHEGGHGIS